MSNIFSYYTKYRDHIGDYNQFLQDSNSKDVRKSSAALSYENEELRKKAKTIADPLLLIDSYEHKKAEDSETFFQTYNIELMSITTLLCSIPIAVTKLIPFLNKHSDKHFIIDKASKLLNSYKNSAINIAGKSISLPKIATIFSAIGSSVFFAKGIKNSMESQLGIIRKASFDATQNIINDHKLFAVLTPEQEQQVSDTINYEERNKNSALVNKLKDKVDIKSSFKEVKEYKRDYKDYQNQKSTYFDNLNKDRKQPLSEQQKQKAVSDKELYENLIKNVEHDVLEPLRKVETISNISYSALFTGGFLEYLITDKLVDVLGIKNKAMQTGIKIGVPLLTYLLLNKNISNIENKAILATKYKHLKQFTENPMQESTPQEEKKQSLIDFIKTVYKDMQDYNQFAENELPKLKERMEAKRQIKLSKQQEEEAKTTQRNITYVINNQREHLYNQSVGIKALSETILGPLDILATAIGGKIGHNLSKKFPNQKLSGLYTGIGAIVAFIPAAILEAKLTKQQKLSEKIAAMLAIKDLQDYKMFADNSNNSQSTYFEIKNNSSSIFKEFIKG